MTNKPVSHKDRRKIHILEARIAELENAIQRIKEIAPNDQDSGLAVQEIANSVLVTDK